MNNFKLKLGDTICISSNPKVFVPEEDQWGHWNFPFISRTKEGYICCSFSLHDDDITAYGKGGIAHFISKDEGISWEHCCADECSCGIEIPGGTKVRFCGGIESLDAKKYPSIGEPDYTYKFVNLGDDELAPIHPGSEAMFREHHYYLLSRLPEEFKTWSFERKTGDGPWEVVSQVIPMPENAVLFAAANRYDYSGPVFVARNYFIGFKVLPNGNILGYRDPFYSTGRADRIVEPRPTFFVSEDNGQTFQYLSQIPFEPDSRFPEARMYQNRALIGFTEPQIEVLANGTIVCLLRTHEGPDTLLMSSYICYSYDNGKTWTKPEVFDELGVFPQILNLKCGVTLASYGRPCIYVKATDDPEAKVWQPRVCIMDKSFAESHSCSYTGLLELDDNNALIVYSDIYVQEDGKPHKSIVARKIEVVEE